MFLTVVTSSRSAGIGRGLTYETTEENVRPGTSVKVPLRKRIVDGIVIEVLKERTQTEYDLRSIKEIVGDEPLLTEAQLKTVRWMSEYYCCSLRQALQVWLPPPPWSKLLIKTQADPSTSLRTGGLRPVSTPQIEDLRLTDAQKTAYESIKHDPRPSLLFGITSSGKTEIYAAMIADAIRAGKRSILLVPEILLTEHVIDRFEKMLPRERISVLHSRLKPAERKHQWKRIHAGEVSLVIGSRSALFAPLRNLGLVILDEEHEWTYKNEQVPRYHARETAEELCRNAVAKLVLGSATPSLESWSRTKAFPGGGPSGPPAQARMPAPRYQLVRLSERFGRKDLPTVKIIDLAQVEFGKNYPFSAELIAAIGARLQKGEQSVLFLNRRGMASALLCMDCRRRVTSPKSLLPFTVHHNSDGVPYLMDHTTGIRTPVPKECSHCRSMNMREVGAGTQRIETILKKLFPKARLLRADTDTLKTPEQMRTLLQKMRNGEADILLGTQTVAKGLDLPSVTLAAVLIADIGFSLPHFRAGERIFQLLTQLTGRSGRVKPGQVIIQTFRPEAPEVLAASRHETERYLDDELRMRLHTKYPPATSMIRVLFRGKDAEARVNIFHSEAIARSLRSGEEAKITISPTLFGGGREWQVLLRGEKFEKVLETVELNGGVVDRDPIETV